MLENRKEAEIYIRKLHEMLPELKEKYHVSNCHKINLAGFYIKIIYSKQFRSGYQYRSRYQRKSVSRMESGKAPVKGEKLEKSLRKV